MPTMTHARRSVLSGTIALGAAISLIVPASANAAEPSTIVIPTEGGTTSDHWEYGNEALDPSATSLLIDSYRREGQGPVDCTLNGNESVITTASFTGEEWNGPGPVEMALPDGGLSDGVSNLTCESTSVGRYWNIVWYLHTDSEGGGTNIVQEDDAFLFFYLHDQTFDAGPAHVVSPGATVLLAGPWEYGDDPEVGGSTRASLTSTDSRFAPITLPATYDLGEPYGLVVQIPTDLPAGFTDAPATLSASSSSYTGQGDRLYRTLWSGPVVFGDAIASRTSLTLERRFGTSRERLTASAVATTAGGVVPTGTMDFYLNSRLIGSVDVDAQGRASILLPKLPRGKHFVVGTFRGTDDVKPSSSAAASIRILI